MTERRGIGAICSFFESERAIRSQKKGNHLHHSSLKSDYRAIRSRSLFFKERLKQIANSRALRMAILSEGVKSQRGKELIPNPDSHEHDRESILPHC